MNYYQPEFYKFSSDSIFLVKKTLEFIPALSEDSAVDIGTGCGVIPIEIQLKRPNLELTGIEIQEDFEKYFNKNLSLYRLSRIPIFLNTSFFKIDKTKKYDWVFSNPPYFNTKTHRSSPNIKRNICRQFLNEDFVEWCNQLDYLFYEKTIGFILVRDEKYILKLKEFFKIINKWDAPGATLFMIMKLDK